MNVLQKNLRNLFLSIAVAFFAVTLASPGMAKEPYYFVDNGGNPQGLYVKPTCNGEESRCVSFGKYCGTRFYASAYSLKQGKRLWKNKGYINIRQNFGKYKVVCKIRKNG